MLEQVRSIAAAHSRLEIFERGFTPFRDGRNRIIPVDEIGREQVAKQQAHGKVASSLNGKKILHARILTSTCRESIA